MHDKLACTHVRARARMHAGLKACPGMTREVLDTFVLVPIELKKATKRGAKSKSKDTPEASVATDGLESRVSGSPISSPPLPPPSASFEP